MGRSPEKKKGSEPPRQAKPKKRLDSRLTVWILVVLLVGVGIQLYGLVGQLRSAREEEQTYARQLAELQESNRRLQEDIDNSGDMGLIEDIARDELGMVSPGEKIIRYGNGK